MGVARGGEYVPIQPELSVSDVDRLAVDDSFHGTSHHTVVIYAGL